MNNPIEHPEIETYWCYAQPFFVNKGRQLEKAQGNGNNCIKVNCLKRFDITMSPEGSDPITYEMTYEEHFMIDRSEGLYEPTQEELDAKFDRFFLNIQNYFNKHEMDEMFHFPRLHPKINFIRKY